MRHMYELTPDSKNYGKYIFFVSGVFITKNDIGTGTILGSAVFNVLFVIGICALYSGHVSLFLEH